MLLASVIRGGRAIPVYAAVFNKKKIQRSQNTWENNFLRLLFLLLKECQGQACLLADRGFRRVRYLQILLDQKDHTFLVRISDQITVEFKKKKCLLKNCGLQPGRAIDLGPVLLRQDGAVTVRVIGIWAKGQKEPWWLATNRDDSLPQLAALYDRRMAIEEQIRDTKGARFGLKLVWTQIQTPEALARFTILIGLAILLLTAIGHAIAMRHPNVLLTSQKKGPRLSFLTIGLLFFQSFLANNCLSLNLLKQHIPPPTLRSFPWLENTEERKIQK
ncbi:MAG: transposase [Thermodesulfobacteriota bacterium]